MYYPLKFVSTFDRLIFILQSSFFVLVINLFFVIDVVLFNKTFNKCIKGKIFLFKVGINVLIEFHI